MSMVTTTRVGDVYVSIDPRLKEELLAPGNRRVVLAGADDDILRTADGKRLMAKGARGSENG